MDRFDVALNKKMPDVPITAVHESVMVVNDCVIPIEIANFSLDHKGVTIRALLTLKNQPRDMMNGIDDTVQLKINLETEEEILKLNFKFLLTDFSFDSKTGLFTINGKDLENLPFESSNGESGRI